KSTSGYARERRPILMDPTTPATWRGLPSSRTAARELRRVTSPGSAPAGRARAGRGPRPARPGRGEASYASVPPATPPPPAPGACSCAGRPVHLPPPPHLTRVSDAGAEAGSHPACVRARSRDRAPFRDSGKAGAAERAVALGTAAPGEGEGRAAPAASQRARE